MPQQVYIAIGNHRSFVGIKEIVHSVQSSLSESLSVKLTRELKSNSVNIIIDEFSGLFDLAVIKKTKELYPNTKIVIVATEFATPVSLLGVQLTKTFNFFGTRDDWIKLVLGALRTFGRRRAAVYADALPSVSLARCNIATFSPSYIRQFCQRFPSWCDNLDPASRRHSRCIRELVRFPSCN